MTEDRDIQSIRDEVKVLINDSRIRIDKTLVEVNNKIDDIINGFSNDDEVVINYDELALIDLDELIVVNDKVSFKKVFQNDVVINFITYVKPGGSFGIHKHDCYEITKVIQGNLVERTYSMKTYEEGQTVIYSPNEPHIPFSTVESVYDVTFCRELIK